MKKINQKIASTIKKNPFNYATSKIIAKMILEGLDKREIYLECFTKNKVNIKSLPRRREIINEIYRRLLGIDSKLLNFFYTQDIITSKFILIYAIAKADHLFFDFLALTYRNALLGEKKYISRDDFDIFFISKKETDLTVANWSKTTVELLSKAYRKLLVDSSLGIRRLRNIYVQRVFIHPEIYKYIEEIGDYNYLQAIMGER
jgi:hypothetical protein